MATPRRVQPVPDADDKYVREPFVYTIGKNKIELPSLSWLKPGLVRKIRHLGEIDQMYTLFELVLPEKQLALLDDLEPDQFEDLCNQWRDHSGVAVGES